MAALVGKFVKPPQTELVKRLPQERLDKQLTEVELSLISEHILDWQSKAYGLGLSSSDVENIREDFKISNKMQKLQMLLRWSEICGEKATLRELIQMSRRHEWGSKFIIKACKELGYSCKDEACLLGLVLCISSYWKALLMIVMLLVAILLPLIYTNFASLSAQSSSLPLPLETFVGRQEELRNLTLLLKYTHDAPRIVSITGGPGFGKSTLAIHIGNELKDRGVDVIYVNVNEVPSVHVLTRKILSSDDCEIENSNKNVTLHHLHKWSKKLQRETLLILDNCDEQFHINKNQLQKFITELVIKHSRHQTLKVLTTSRQHVMYLQGHEPLILNELPKHHACVLLRNIASFTDSSCNDIINLTGNVPLALHVIGALTKMPNPPSHMKIIDKLKENLIDTLSPENLQTEERVNASIHLSYQYLNATLQKMGRLLAHFPGSFDEGAACRVLNTSIMCSHNLRFFVQRSLLEYNTESSRYNYHRLIRQFFISKSSPTEFKKFHKSFSEYFIERMTEKSFIRALFGVDRHNIQYLFDLLTTLKDKKQSKKVVEIFMKIAETINHIVDSHNLDYRFTPMELQDYLKAILFYFERNSPLVISIFGKDQFVQVYSRTAMHLIWVKKHLINEERLALINVMEEYQPFFYKYKSSISSDLYQEFFNNLAKYYEDIGDYRRAIQCYRKRVGEKCKQNECNNVEIADAYYQMKDYNKSIQFYEKELSLTTDTWKKYEIILKLYDIYVEQFDYSNAYKTSLRFRDIYYLFFETSEVIDHGSVILRVIDKTPYIGMPSFLESLLVESIEAATVDQMSALNSTLYAAYLNHKYNISKLVGRKMLEVNKLPMNKYFSNTSFLLGVSLYWTGDYNESRIHLTNYLSFQKLSHTFRQKCSTYYYLFKLGSVEYFPFFLWRMMILIFYISPMEQLPQFSASQRETIHFRTDNDPLSTELVLASSSVAVYQKIIANAPQVKHLFTLLYDVYQILMPILYFYYYFIHICTISNFMLILLYHFLSMLYYREFLKLLALIFFITFFFDTNTKIHHTGYYNNIIQVIIMYASIGILILSDYLSPKFHSYLNRHLQFQ